jgi:hypothetical protein
VTFARASLACALVAGAVSSATAESPPESTKDTYLSRLVNKVRTRLDDMAAAHAPKIVPPVPVNVTFRQPSRKLLSFDAGAPLVALAGADLDGDGKRELYAVTSNQVIALAWRGARIAELGRVAFSGDRAVPASRDPVGTAFVNGNQLIAASSAWAREIAVTWDKKSLVAQVGNPGFQRCTHNRVALRSGRNFFEDNTYGKVCREDLVDAGGYPLHATATLSTSGKLVVETESCQPGGATCRPGISHTYSSGAAFAIGDVNRDGNPEIVVSGLGAVGDDDFIRVITIGHDEKKALFTSQPKPPGVVALAVTDLDGDGVDEVIVALRLHPGNIIDLVRFD